MTQIIATATPHTRKNWRGEEVTYYRVELDPEPFEYSVEAMSIYREALERYSALEQTPENEAIIDDLECHVREMAEELEVLFIYDRNGKTRIYTPAAHWEASGSCSEWEESAQEGYDFGWDI